MMGTEMVPEMSVSSYNQVMWLTAREDFTEFSHRKNFKSYKKNKCLKVTEKLLITIQNNN
jgi:hypothetical protein